MKGIILAAGKATRLYPITREISKMILPVYNKPVIYYPVKILADSGINEIMIVSGSAHVKQLMSVTMFNDEFKDIKFKFKVKNHELGMPYSIYQARNWAKNEPVMVIPGDNIFSQDYKKEIHNFERGAVVHLGKVKDPERFGTIVLKDKKIIDLVEKPRIAQTKYALIAPYIFDKEVFNYIKTLNVSKRGELEITDLLKIYLYKHNLTFHKIHGYWKDIGTHEALLEAGIYFKKLSLKKSSSG
jgi:glucose-1-phosphate thymidylyltransferase